MVKPVSTQIQVPYDLDCVLVLEHSQKRLNGFQHVLLVNVGDVFDEVRELLLLFVLREALAQLTDHKLHPLCDVAFISAQHFNLVANSSLHPHNLLNEVSECEQDLSAVFAVLKERVKNLACALIVDGIAGLSRKSHARPHSIEVEIRHVLSFYLRCFCFDESEIRRPALLLDH